MTAYRADNLPWLTRVLADAAKEANALISSGVPAVIEVKAEKRGRTVEQNKLQRKWMLEAQQQGDMTAEEYRGYCKLHFGVPIMRAENEEFRDLYDRFVRHLSYEAKMAFMMLPFDFAVTRDMDVNQKARYLDQVYVYLTGLGFKLTEPKQRNRRHQSD